MRSYIAVGCLAAALLLTALMYPIFGRANAKANQAYCRCNVEQLALAIRMYAADSDGRLPDRSWQTAMRPYYKTYRVEICPQDSRLPWHRRNPAMADGKPVSFVSYAMVERWARQKLPGKPANGIAFYEVGDQGPDFRHFDGMTLGFLDGHVRWHSRDALARAVLATGLAPTSSPPAP